MNKKVHGCIVSNTGPMIALAIIEKLDILKNIFYEVIVPEAVHNELIHGGRNEAGLTAYKQASWIQVKKLSKSIEPLLNTVLDSGEASVIQTCCECKADFVLIDERKGRKVARDVYGLEVIGSMRILVEAKRQGIIKNVGEAIEGMRNGGYWIHNNIVEFVLKEAGEVFKR